MTLQKKLINYDQNPLRVDQINPIIQTLELMPFDGMVASMLIADPVLGSGNSSITTWAGSSWDWSLAQTPIADIRGTKFNKFKDNFLYIKCVTTSVYGNKPVDWFDPAFQSVVNNWIFTARVAAQSAGFFKGIWFDIEPSIGAGEKLFQYNDRPLSSTYTRGEYESQVQKCASLIMEGIQNVYPDIKLLISFGFEQVNKVVTLPKYDLLQSFLNGLFQTAAPGVKIHNMFEDGYGHFTTSQFDEDIQDVFDPVGSPRVKLDETPSRYFNSIKKGNTIWLDYIDDAHPVFSTTDNTVNYFSASKFQTAVTLALTYANSLAQLDVDTYCAVYSESVKWLTSNPTVPRIYVDALNAARVAAGLQPSFLPLTNSNLVGYFDPITMAFGNNVPINTYVDPKGATWTQSVGGAQPVFKSSSINNHPGVLFTGSNFQYLTADALASYFTGTHKPFTFIFVVKPNSLSTYQNFICCGGNGTNNPQIEIDHNSSNLVRSQKVDNSATAASLITAASITTAPYIITVVNKENVGTIRVNGISDPIPSSQDVGLMTLNLFTLGARRTATTDLFFDGYFGSVAVFNAALGLDQIKYFEKGFANQYSISLLG